MCVRARAQQILIFHEQQKLKPMSLKCQPSAASQVYPRCRRQRENEEKGVKGTRERDRNIERKREAMRNNRNTKAGEMKRRRQRERKTTQRGRGRETKYQDRSERKNILEVKLLRCL